MKKITASSMLRFAAFTIDNALLTALMYGIYRIMPMAMPYNLILYLVLASIYFVLQDSYLGKGQTLGKRIMRISLVDRIGNYISVERALLRFWLLVPTLLVFITPYSMRLMNLVGMLFMIATIYFFLFNFQTDQSLQDVVLDTYVINEGDQMTPSARQPLWKGHYPILGSLLAAILALNYTDTMTFSSFLPNKLGTSYYYGKTSEIDFKRFKDSESIHSVSLMYDKNKNHGHVIVDLKSDLDRKQRDQLTQEIENVITSDLGKDLKSFDIEINYSQKVGLFSLDHSESVSKKKE